MQGSVRAVATNEPNLPEQPSTPGYHHQDDRRRPKNAGTVLPSGRTCGKSAWRPHSSLASYCHGPEVLQGQCPQIAGIILPQVVEPTLGRAQRMVAPFYHNWIKPNKGQHPTERWHHTVTSAPDTTNEMTSVNLKTFDARIPPSR